MTIDEFNELEPMAQHAILEKCCGAQQWIKQMIARAPFSSLEHLIYFADYNWDNSHEESWMEAFTSHSKIEGSTSQLNTEEIQQYEKKFGYPFIVAEKEMTEKEMGILIQERLSNSEEEELFVAMQEQQKITKIKLGELFREE